MTEDALAHLRTNVLNPLHALQVHRKEERAKLDALIRAGDEEVAKLLPEHDQLTQAVDLVNQRKDDLNDEIRKIRQAMTKLENQKKAVARLLQRYHLQPTPRFG
jgi:predicted  nucleic acid-binding Zn-ribbon protein